MKWLRYAGILAALLIPTVSSAQIPTSINIRTAVGTDSTKFTFSWPLVSGYSTYDLITFSSPRSFDFEQIRVVTGNSWTIAVPNSRLTDSTLIYGSVRVSMRPRYGAITYRTPVPPSEVLGCTNSEATNYNPLATVDDGSCIVPPEPTVNPWVISLVSQTILLDTLRSRVTVAVRQQDGTPVAGAVTVWAAIDGIGGFGDGGNPGPIFIATDAAGTVTREWKIVPNVFSQISIAADSAIPLMLSHGDSLPPTGGNPVITVTGSVTNNVLNLTASWQPFTTDVIYLAVLGGIPLMSQVITLAPGTTDWTTAIPFDASLVLGTSIAMTWGNRVCVGDLAQVQLSGDAVGCKEYIAVLR